MITGACGRIDASPGDGGVDGVINEDRLGLDLVYVQAKRYSDGTVVGRPAVQSFVGSLVGMGATKGVFVTTSKFSADAMEFARNLTQRVILIDGRRLTKLMIEHGVGVRLNRSIEFKKIDEDYFDLTKKTEELSITVVIFV
jgi:restriction system protein